jgi:hypothetical protein
MILVRFNTLSAIAPGIAKLTDVRFLRLMATTNPLHAGAFSVPAAEASQPPAQASFEPPVEVSVFHAEVSAEPPGHLTETHEPFLDPYPPTSSSALTSSSAHLPFRPLAYLPTAPAIPGASQ